MFAILCEEVRDEKAGTRSLIGVFPPEGIRALNIPFIIPKFALFTSSELDGQKDVTFEIEIVDPSNKSVFKFKSPKLTGLASRKKVYFAVNISPLQITRAGTYSVKITRDDGESVVATLDVALLPGKQSPSQN
jgi:hypothetical protein